MRRRLHYLIYCVMVLGMILPGVATADLLGWWKLDEGDGMVISDASGNGYDTTVDPWNPAEVAWTADGYLGSGLDFPTATGIATTVDIPLPNGVLNVQDATYSFWMKMPTVFQAWGIIFVLIGDGDDHSLEPDGAGDLFNGRGPWFGTSGLAINDDQWHHIAVSFTGEGVTIYVDGQPVATAAGGLSDPINTVRIGGPRSAGRAQWRRFTGQLDEAAVYNHGLSADEVQNLFWFGPQWTLFATVPDPADSSYVSNANITLNWTAGENAAQHRVYVGENHDNVLNGTDGTDQGLVQEASFSNYPWELGKTYYWRVDAIDGDGTEHPGVVWSFSTAPKTAYNPGPADGAVLVDTNVTLSWSAGSDAVSRDVYWGTSPDALTQVADDQAELTFVPDNVANNTIYYWRVDEFDGSEVYTGEVWQLKTTPDIPVIDASLVGWYNFDADEEGIAVDWSGNGNHGTIVGDPQSVPGTNFDALSFDGMDDYVQVPQSVTADFTLMAWISTTTPGAEGDIGRDGTGLLWSDHAGGGDHYAVSVLGNNLAFETGPGGTPTLLSSADVVTGDWIHVAVTRAIDTGDVQIFIDGVLDASDTHGNAGVTVGSNPFIVLGANLLDSRFYTGSIDEVRCYDRILTEDEIAQIMISDPNLARAPSPGSGATPDIERLTSLSWTPGDNAVQHDVYFGTDESAVESADASDTTGVYRGRQSETSYSPPETLEMEQTYFWRIDEINGDDSVHMGRVWRFTVADYIVIDDFEGYTDGRPDRIFETWRDRWAYTDAQGNVVEQGNGTGMTVGVDDAPFGPERTIVFSGRQSMPLTYDNTESPYYSETDRTFAQAQNWQTRAGRTMETLSLQVRGRWESPNGFTRDGSTYTVTGSGVDIWNTSDEFHFVYLPLNGDGSITARVDSIDNTDPWAKAGVMIRDGLDADAANVAAMYAPSGRVTFQIREFAGVETISQETGAGSLTAPYWVRLTRTGGIITGEMSVDGQTWEDIAGNSSVSVSMFGNVVIGLAVTSHVDAGTPAQAVLSNVQVTGAAGSMFTTSADIGLQVNEAADLYVVIEDAGGNTAVFNHPDNPNAVLVNDWAELSVLLSDFADQSVDLTQIRKMIIGVGDQQAGGFGKLFVDDIRLYPEN